MAKNKTTDPNALPEYMTELISDTEAIGRDEQEREIRPVAGYRGLYERHAAGSAKSSDGTSKVAYGIVAAQIKKGDEALVPSPGARDVLFLGVEGVTSVKDVKKRVTSFVRYEWHRLGMDEEAACVYVLERFNHAWNIDQRSNFSPYQSGAAAFKAVTDTMRDSMEAGIDPEVLEEEAAKFVQSLSAKKPWRR